MKEECKVIYEDIVKPACKYVRYGGEGFLGGFALPTLIRRIRSNAGTECPKDRFNFLEIIRGITTGISASVVLVFEGTFPAYVHDNPAMSPSEYHQGLIYFLAPIATNLLSGGYEIWRYAREKVRSHLSGTSATISPVLTPSVPASSIEKGKLEEKIEEEKMPDSREIPNPWDIDIPEIKNIYRGKS